MHQDEITALFNQQAANYDAQWAKTVPIRHCLHLLLGASLADLPKDANILCVGVGTGDELIYLATENPGWTFTAVEPSGAMLDICRHRAQQADIAARCVFHEGYLDSHHAPEKYDAATCFLVSQFLLDEAARSGFFSEIAARLKPDGLLASSDLASDIESPEYEVLLQAWMHMMSAADVSADAIERMRKAYANDVGVLPAGKIASIITSGGFELPVQFFQAGLIHGWLSKRAGKHEA
ncbi:SAM-dependent methyltransferase [Methylophaga lonarensis MPL]|uniref:SAM-dependent methyltransferase n=2 Tax=Methylophaga lonarensis TaxID=999151 RepID=M7NXR9_9GAMM|nr:SAM-dependent methyltransferase [Methylophaga lonarensis MPL]